MKIQNPILPGFHPDPSICRVGDDYYIVNSTFEWFPGVPVHHSKDLKNWRLVGHILTRQSQLDLRGVVDSAGVWAPSLSHADGKFWLVYTNIRNTGFGRPFKDIKIFLTTSGDILGPWSEPTELDSIGFDPSLFHDDDGRKYLVNMEWDFRKGRFRFAGIVVQEFEAMAGKLVGARTKIMQKDKLSEGPNLYKRDGWYYLMLAEGGTGWNHGIAMARSRSILGPYELDPQDSVMTTRDNYGHALQKAGHGELVETQAGEWYLAHLTGRPVHFDRRCILGRETCLQRVKWQDGWLRLEQDGYYPLVEVAMPAGLPECPWPAPATRDDFTGEKLDPSWSSLRVPMDDSWLSLSARPGWLRLTGRDSLHSFFEQSLVAKRLECFDVIAETCMDFEPQHFTQSAGLICHYNTRMHYYLRVTFDESEGKVLGIVLTDNGNYDELDGQLTISDWSRVFLRGEIHRERLQFSASTDGVAWRNVGPVLDASKLSDDYAQGFTGAMIGICAQDLSGNRRHADFDYFSLQPL
ncbi:MAG: glycoside hydrolase family 43 protein [Luteolibacter sp.]